MVLQWLGVSSPLYPFAKVYFALEPGTLFATLLIALSCGLLASVFSNFWLLAAVAFKRLDRCLFDWDWAAAAWLFWPYSRHWCWETVMKLSSHSSRVITYSARCCSCVD